MALSRAEVILLCPLMSPQQLPHPSSYLSIESDHCPDTGVTDMIHQSTDQTLPFLNPPIFQSRIKGDFLLVRSAPFNIDNKAFCMPLLSLSARRGLKSQ